MTFIFIVAHGCSEWAFDFGLRSAPFEGAAILNTPGFAGGLLFASEDFKSMTKEQQEVRAKQFAGEWMPRFAADAKARSQDIASRVLELRKRREREGS